MTTRPVALPRRAVCLAALVALVPWQGRAADPPRPLVAVLTVDGPISPGSADYVVRGLARAAEQSAALVVLRLDTPGGLDMSMRTIVREILASPVPVACWVAPEGARAASAGTFLLYGCHIAAMAPATTLGAATPVQLGPGGKEPPVRPPSDQTASQDDDQAGGDAHMRKAVHDAAAYIRGLAQLRGRNAQWAERAVREAVSLTAREALAQEVIDLLAADLDALLEQADGRSVQMAAGTRTLELGRAQVEEWTPDWRSRLLETLAHPEVAYLLLLVGLYGLVFELSNPGAILPGVLGGICLLLALYALQMLPVAWAGMALLLLGIAFLIAEAFAPSYGVLGIGGLVAFVVGSVMLFRSDAPGYSIRWWLVLPAAVVTGAFLLMVVGTVWRARRRPVVSGRELLIGSQGLMLQDCDGDGWAQVEGERWQVHCATPLRRGQRVCVTAMHGLRLTVQPEEER